VRGLCEELDLVHGVDPFVAPSARAHHLLPPSWYRGYRHRFTEPELDELLRRLPTSAQGYIFFNNISMWDDAVSLVKKLAKSR
jgi:uncharacterized protein YecE (DUF72 family)